MVKVPRERMVLFFVENGVGNVPDGCHMHVCHDLTSAGIRGKVVADPAKGGLHDVLPTRSFPSVYGLRKAAVAQGEPDAPVHGLLMVSNGDGEVASDEELFPVNHNEVFGYHSPCIPFLLGEGDEKVRKLDSVGEGRWFMVAVHGFSLIGSGFSCIYRQEGDKNRKATRKEKRNG